MNTIPSTAVSCEWVKLNDPPYCCVEIHPHNAWRKIFNYQNSFRFCKKSKGILNRMNIDDRQQSMSGDPTAAPLILEYPR